MMPDIDGYEVMEEMKHRGDSTPVIVISASAMEEEKRKAMRASAKGFVRKPFQKEELLTCIREVLGTGYFEHVPDPLQAPKAYAIDWSLVDADLRRSIEEAVLAGDVGELEQLAARVGEVNEQLGLQFTQLVGNFQFDTILREMGCQS